MGTISDHGVMENTHAWTPEQAAAEAEDNRLRNVLYDAMKAAGVTSEDGQAVLDRWDATSPWAREA